MTQQKNSIAIIIAPSGRWESVLWYIQSLSRNRKAFFL